MDFLRGYSTLGEFKNKVYGRGQEEVQSAQNIHQGIQGPQSMRSQGMLSGPQPMQTMQRPLDQKQLERKYYKQVLGGVQGEYGTAKKEIDKAEADVEQQYKEARDKLKTPQKWLDYTYDKWDKENLIDIWIISEGKYEAKYRIHPDDLNEAWQKSLTDPSGADLDLRPGKDPKTGLPVMTIDVHGYGAEAHKNLAMLPDRYKAGMKDKVYEKWGEASQQAGKGYLKAMGQVDDYRSQLRGEGQKLGRMMADKRVGVSQELQGTAVEQGYQQRKGERTQGFKVLGVGQGTVDINPLANKPTTYDIPGEEK